MKRFLNGAWTGLLWLGALGLLAYAALAAWPVDHRLPDVALQFARPMLIASGIAVAVILLSRRWLAAVPVAAAGAWLFLTLQPYGLTNAEPRPDGLRVYVSNTWVGNEQPDRLAASIREADADVVVLIELGTAIDASLDTILAAYPHRVASPMIRGRTGASRSVIASRWPVRELGREVRDGLPVIVAEVGTPQGPLTVYGLHLTRPWPYQVSTGQTWQLERLFTRLDDTPVRTIVAGDFNSAPPSSAISRVIDRSGLALVSGAHGTWPARAPAFLRLPIDHALASPDIQPVAARRGLPTGSDHSPLVVDLRLGPPEPG